MLWDQKQPCAKTTQVRGGGNKERRVQGGSLSLCGATPSAYSSGVQQLFPVGCAGRGTKEISGTTHHHLREQHGSRGGRRPGAHLAVQSSHSRERVLSSKPGSHASTHSAGPSETQRWRSRSAPQSCVVELYSKGDDFSNFQVIHP
jgi:hypothetical protein